VSALTLAQAKTHLNITSATYDAELQTFIDTAESVVSAYCGPLSSSAATYRVRATGDTLVLPVAPILSVTSVTPVYPTGAAALTMTDLWTDTDAAIVRYVSGQWFGVGWYDVAATVGRSSVPPDLLMAIKEELRHLWKTQRGSALGRPGSSPEDNPDGGGYLVPYHVMEMLAPYRQVRVS